MRIPVQTKILREDLKDAPDWVMGIIGPINQFMETITLALNKNIDGVNLAEQIHEVDVRVPSSYPTMDPILFRSTLKTRAIGMQVMQCYEKSTFTPISVGNPAWKDTDGNISITSVPGLTAGKTYVLRVRLV